MRQKPEGKAGKKPEESAGKTGGKSPAFADKRRSAGPQSAGPAGENRSGKRPRISASSPSAGFQSRIRPENRGKESTARMEAEDRRKAGFSSEKPPREGGFPQSGGERSFRPTGRTGEGKISRPERGGNSRSGDGRSGLKREFSSGDKRENPSGDKKPYAPGRPRRSDGPEGREKKSFDKGSRFPAPRGERSSTGPGAAKRVSPAKNRLGTQAPEQAREFRRRGSNMPDYDEQKLAAMAGGRARKPAGRKIREKDKEPKKTGEEQLVRLNRFIAQSGLCSRREADDLISTGQITVNGKVMDQMGYLVKSGDVVKYGRRLLNKEKLVYVLLNKPKDFLTTTEDPEERKTVMTLVENACKERIYPVGRLDRNTTGLLLLTNDGELSERLMHPSHNIRKIYQVDLDKPLTANDEAAVRAGVELEDGKASVDELEVLSKERDIVGLSIHIGRNRIVRRIFESLGYKVIRLDRVMYAGLTKKDLPRGTWRYLTEKEVINIKFFS